MERAAPDVQLAGNFTKAQPFVTAADGGFEVDAGRGPSKADALGPGMIEPRSCALNDGKPLLFLHAAAIFAI